MKRLLGAALLAALLAGLGACQKKDQAASASSSAAPAGAPASATIPAQPPVDGPLVMTAELQEIPGQFPANEIYNYAYIMKYKVVKVLKGQYTDADILIAHYNPRIARADIKDDQHSKVGGNLKTFKVGDVHYLVLTDLDAVWTGALEDEYYKDKRHRYWALWADKL